MEKTVIWPLKAPEQSTVRTKMTFLFIIDIIDVIKVNWCGKISYYFGRSAMSGEDQKGSL